MKNQNKNLVSDQAEMEILRKQLLANRLEEDGILHSGQDHIPDDLVVDQFLLQFGSKDDSPLKAHDWKAYVPISMFEAPFCGPIFGIVREESESIYIFDAAVFQKNEYKIGYAMDDSCHNTGNFEEFSLPKHYITVRFQDDQLSVTLMKSEQKQYSNGVTTIKPETTDSECSHGVEVDIRLKKYDTVTNLFSRNTGLLESADMLDKCVVLVGCGSVGSFVAMELARSGVGKFVLCDTDTLEIHNICRHQCGFDDLGRFKVDAIKDKILNINPFAEVVTYRSQIQDVSESDLAPFLGKDTIIIGGGDNRESSDWGCKLAIRSSSSFLSTSCWSRAFAGEIFYWAPGLNLSCYTCALGELLDDDRPESHGTYFGTDKEKETLAFEPGIAVDIDFVTIVAVKLVLDLLNRGNANYTPRVLNHLKQYTWVCNTNSTKIGGDRAAMFPGPLWITNNLSVQKDETCVDCGNSSLSEVK